MSADGAGNRFERMSTDELASEIREMTATGAFGNHSQLILVAIYRLEVLNRTTIADLSSGEPTRTSTALKAFHVLEVDASLITSRDDVTELLHKAFLLGVDRARELAKEDADRLARHDREIGYPVSGSLIEERDNG